tara:strand:+ start:771 stop:1484 length:714 start_codon:yes stop_codon:yes gene_type:complete
MSNQNNVIALTEQQEILNEKLSNIEAMKKGADFAKTFNKKYASLLKAESALIDIVREVVATDSRYAIKQFKKDVNADNSTINRYIKIAECEFINENADRLPKTVSVLLRIAQQFEKCDFANALEEEILNSDTTLKELNEYIKETAESNDDGMVESESSTEEVVESEEPAEIGVLSVNLEGWCTHHIEEVMDMLNPYSDGGIAELIYMELGDIKRAFEKRNEKVALENARFCAQQEAA